MGIEGNDIADEAVQLCCKLFFFRIFREVATVSAFMTDAAFNVASVDRQLY